MMPKKILYLLAFLSIIWLAPLQAEEIQKLTFDIGGGVSAPLNPIARYVGTSGNFVTGAGVNLNKNNSIEGDFMWSGLPPNLTNFHPLLLPRGSMNLFTLTANYRYHLDNIGGSMFGAYLIGGGGWYYRHFSINKNFIVPPNTVCQPVWFWWGYGCDSSGFVASAEIASGGNSAGGVDAGAGFTVKIGNKGWKFYTEARYNYAWSRGIARIPTTLIPVTLGIRYN
jgi:hypothetical protein